MGVTVKTVDENNIHRGVFAGSVDLRQAKGLDGSGIGHRQWYRSDQDHFSSGLEKQGTNHRKRLPLGRGGVYKEGSQAAGDSLTHPLTFP